MKIIITSNGAFRIFSEPVMRNYNGNQIASYGAINIYHKPKKPFDIGFEYIPILHVKEIITIESIEEFIKLYPEKSI